jgi:hypothetical protein
MRTPRNVFVFPNGNVAVTDADGEQIPELQGRFGEVAERILDVADSETQFFGWPGTVHAATPPSVEPICGAPLKPGDSMRFPTYYNSPELLHVTCHDCLQRINLVLDKLTF